MIDYTKEIANLLEGLAPVELAGSEGNKTLPMIVIQQISNSPSVSFEGKDFLTASRYQIDCYAEVPQKCIAMAEAVDSILQGEGWQRVNGQLMGRQRYLLTYKALIDEKYKVYKE